MPSLANSPSIADVLHATLRQLEQMPEFRRNDPTMVELRKFLLRTILELELRKDSPRKGKNS